MKSDSLLVLNIVLVQLLQILQQLRCMSQELGFESRLLLSKCIWEKGVCVVAQRGVCL